MNKKNTNNNKLVSSFAKYVRKKNENNNFFPYNTYNSQLLSSTDITNVNKKKKLRKLYSLQGKSGMSISSDQNVGARYTFIYITYMHLYINVYNNVKEQ